MHAARYLPEYALEGAIVTSKGDDENEATKAAKRLSKLGAQKGGEARAKKLSPAERKEIARKAGAARWQKAGKDAAPTARVGTELPYSMFRGTLHIGNLELDCHVLNDGRRVLTQREVVRVLTGGRDSGTLGRYLERLPGADPADVASRTISFRVDKATTAIGYEATLLIEICDLYLKARDEKNLNPRQLPLAKSAEIIMRSCAKVGIIALIDEATGYQQVRARNALQLKLQAFIADEMQEWAKMFPDEFWFELARLEGIQYSPRSRPLRWGRYVMMFVYDAIDSDVGKELRKINPNPHFKQNHHQWLREHGQREVNNQIQRVITIMKLCDDMDEFRRKFAKVFQKSPLQMELWDSI